MRVQEARSEAKRLMRAARSRQEEGRRRKGCSDGRRRVYRAEGLSCRDGEMLVVGLRMTAAGDEREIDTGVTRSAATRHANPRSGPAQPSTTQPSCSTKDSCPHRAFAKQPTALLHHPDTFATPAWDRVGRADPFGQFHAAPTPTNAGKSSRGSVNAIPRWESMSSFFSQRPAKNHAANVMLLYLAISHRADTPQSEKLQD